MTRFLLDVNVLIALIDPRHEHHLRANTWFASVGKVAWATCPMTQNAVVRIVGGPSYSKSHSLTSSVVLQVTAAFCDRPGHEFWPDSISLFDGGLIDPAGLLGPKQVTDLYLLALAVSRGGRFATFDRRISADSVVLGTQALYLIP